MTIRPRILAFLCAPVCALALVGCETRVVRYNPILGGLPGAESGRPVVRDFGDYRDPTIISEDQLVQEQPDGKKTLIARTGKSKGNSIPRACSCMNRLTTRSSSEWKLITAIRPPGASVRTTCGNTARSSRNSSLTAMRMA